MKLDTNGDGLISEAEFIAGHKDPDHAKKIFDAADTNKDGQLDRKELSALRAKQDAWRRQHQAAAAPTH